MSDAHAIVRQVNAAKHDLEQADSLIVTYLPFIKAETARFLNRSPIMGRDDELNIAMMAFHEAIQEYSVLKGSFFRFAALLIRNRLIDYQRKEERHSGLTSLDEPFDEEGATLLDTLPSSGESQEGFMHREATAEEIALLSREMQEFGISFTDVVDNCPRQNRTFEACCKVIAYAKGNDELLDEFLSSKRLPVAKLVEGSGVERKTIERHRKYLVAMLLIYTNGFEIIRGHLSRIVRGYA